MVYEPIGGLTKMRPLAHSTVGSRLSDSEQLSAELEDLKRLHALSLRLTAYKTLADVLNDVLRTAASLVAAPLGSAQLLTPEGDLGMVGQIGFGESILDEFGVVRLEDCTTCAVALQRGSRVSVQDLRKEPQFTGIAAALRSYGAVAAVSTPVVDPGGNVLAMFSVYWQEEREPSDRELRALDLCADLAGRHVERNVAAKALHDREQRLAATYENGPIGIVEIDLDGRFVAVNRHFRELVGYEADELTRLSAADITHPDDRTAHEDAFKRLVAGDVSAVETEKRYVRKDGSIVWVSVRRNLAMSETRQSGYVIEVNVDLTARKVAEEALRESEERKALLMRELAHRGKNLVSVIQSIAMRSLSGERTLDDAREVFIGRLQALASTYSTLTDETPESAQLRDIVKAGLKSHSERAEIRGPAILVPAKTAQTLALVVHELATNAAKYGGLSVPSGRVEVSWELVRNGGDDEQFLFKWSERLGPPVKSPAHKGFGSVIITSVVGTELNCAPTMEYAEEGFRYSLACSSSALAGTSA